MPSYQYLVSLDILGQYGCTGIVGQVVLRERFDMRLSFDIRQRPAGQTAI
jgi:hypothetical protein